MLASPIGHYIPGRSRIHALDARVKLVSFVVLIIFCASLSKPAQLIWAWAGFTLLVALSKLSPKPVLASIKPIIPFACIVALFNLFVVQGGTTLTTLGPLTLSTGGIWAAILYTSRLLLAVGIGAVLLLTTTPTALTDAFEALLSPLTKLGLPAHEISMVLSLALRFVPILADEAQSVIDAQAARGGSIEDGTAKERLQAMSAILISVFAGALRHAENLSRALDARCYEGGAGRTHYHEMHIDSSDFAYLAACILWLVALITLGIVL